MVKALLDTNILIDYLNGFPQAQDEIVRYRETAISIISWMEVLVGADPEQERITRAFLDRFTLVQLDEVIAERAVAIRQLSRIKLPDAIVWASAQVHAMLLV